MSITKEQVKALTPEHRVVWKHPDAPREVETGLWVDMYGSLRMDVGDVVRWVDGGVPAHVLLRIVRIIPPAFTPRVGMVIGKPDVVLRRLVCFRDDEWLGCAPEISEHGYWFTDVDAHDLIENHGWEVMGDLAAPDEVTDADKEANDDRP